MGRGPTPSARDVLPVIDDSCPVIVFKLLAIISLLASATSSIIGARIVYARDPKIRRLFVSIHISSGIVLCVTSALLAFWAFTEPSH
jgi:hypothetical protein